MVVRHLGPHVVEEIQEEVHAVLRVACRCSSPSACIRSSYPACNARRGPSFMRTRGATCAAVRSWLKGRRPIAYPETNLADSRKCLITRQV
jgi:hypothetical protein